MKQGDRPALDSATAYYERNLKIRGEDEEREFLMRESNQYARQD